MPQTRKKRVIEKKKQKTRKKMSTVDKMVKIFKQYPKIFPRGYFRFLKGNLEEKMRNKCVIFKNGVILTWKKYKKVPSKFKSIGLNVGDIKINQLVNKHQGNGKAKKIFLAFLKKHKNKNIVLDVKKDNNRAIRFYKKNGFKKVGETTFGQYPGIIMKKSHHKKTMKGGKKSYNPG